ncbi:hypothetical protein LshimejAT787_0202580 [Lyophyllum shimeji]|uniref:Uncharacterized protein n=1 Tax=Lyophyllum shimeji TaxID=47721 RepID=A0A9P3PEZ3_LYOSH|nr:hypothetical protein LshimejAT787_0202580 [Lyophyllum shimeji]
MSAAPAILNVHTPSSSFAIVHSVTQDSLQTLFDTLTRKAHTTYHGERVGPGWLKYEFNDSIWNLDDGRNWIRVVEATLTLQSADSDYTIFVWRQHQPAAVAAATPTPTPSATGSSSGSALPTPHTPTIHLHNPTAPLPSPTEYRNPSYYLFRRPAHHVSPVPSTRSKKSQRTKASRRTNHGNGDVEEVDKTPRHKKEFEKFHGENGVRTVMGSIGPVQNVRMLLRAGYRHVYISRKFAIKHGFIPKDAAPGHYGYGGLVNIGTWPITLTPSSTFNAHPGEPPESQAAKRKPREPTLISVFLAEEPHFDVVLGRSFFEKRQIRTSSTDPTDVVCLDTGEKVECELVILKDGRGEIVTVT